MFSKFERMTAWRYLRAKRKEGFISVITGFAFTGIALGVATLIIVMSVMNGFRSELLSRILGLNGHIGIVSSVGLPFNNYKEAVGEIAQIEGVKQVIPMIEKQLLISSGRQAEGAMVRALSPEDLVKKPLLVDSIEGADVSAFEGDVVLVGRRLAQKMGLVPGSELTLISPNGKVTAFGTVPRMKSYKVIGTFDVGMYEYDSNFVFMPLSAAQKYFSLPEAVTQIDVSLDDEKEPTERLSIIKNVYLASRVYEKDGRHTVIKIVPNQNKYCVTLYSVKDDNDDILTEIYFDDDEFNSDVIKELCDIYSRNTILIASKIDNIPDGLGDYLVIDNRDNAIKFMGCPIKIIEIAKAYL